ncbi:hypothetical protein Y888_14490 [Mixta calida B021323]|nr:hypothetical protein Y888_14490 [Mixta calida B021323]
MRCLICELRRFSAQKSGIFSLFSRSNWRNDDETAT